MLQGSLCASSLIIKCFFKIFQQFFILGIISNGNPLQYSCLENPMDGGAW